MGVVVVVCAGGLFSCCVNLRQQAAGQSTSLSFVQWCPLAQNYSSMSVESTTGMASEGDAVSAQVEDNSEQLADFLASKSRLQTRMAGARRDMRSMRATVADEQRHFDAQLQHLRKQVAALLETSRTSCQSRPMDRTDLPRAPGSCAPPSTPAEEQG